MVETARQSKLLLGVAQVFRFQDSTRLDCEIGWRQGRSENPCWLAQSFLFPAVDMCALGSMAYVPPVEAVETVNVVSNSFDAEQGMAGGAAMNVTIKSGTNDVPRRRLGVPHQQRAQGAQLFLLPVLLHGRSEPRAQERAEPVRRHARRSDQEEQAVLLRRLGADHAPAAASALRTVPTAALRAGRLQRHRHDRLRSGDRRMPNGTGRTPFPNNTIPAERIDPAAAYMPNLIPQPNQTVFPNNYLAVGELRVHARQRRLQDQLQPHGQAADFRPLQLLAHAVLRSALARRGGRRRHQRRPTGTRAPGADAEHRHRRNLHRLAAPCCWTASSAIRGCACRRRERRPRQELRAGRPEDSGHQRHGPAAGRLSRASRSTRFRASATRTSRIRSCSATTSTCQRAI